MKGSFRQHVIIDASIIVGSFVVFGGIFYLMAGSLSGKAAEIKADRSLIARRSADIETLSVLKANSLAAAEFQKKVDALLPSRDGLISFPKFMNDLARVHSLSLVFNFDGSPVDPSGSTPGHVEFTAIAEGSYSNLRSFTEEMEIKTTRFMINIQEIDFSTAGTTGRSNIKGVVFFQ